VGKGDGEGKKERCEEGRGVERGSGRGLAVRRSSVGMCRYFFPLF